MGLTIDDVLRDLPRAPQATKVAELAPEEARTYGGLVHKLASLLRDIPEPEISWASLNAVKVAGYRSTPPRTVKVRAKVAGDAPGDDLREMAAAVRNLKNEQAVEFFHKNAAALKAIRGLTLLRERVKP